MPELDLYWKSALIAAAGASGVTFALLTLGKQCQQGCRNSVMMVAIAIGFCAGNWFLELNVAWPPRNGLERFLIWILPLAFIIELGAGWNRLPKRYLWLFRLALAVATPRILLHGSVYLSDHSTAWSTSQAILTLGSCSILLILTWGISSWLCSRSGTVIIPFSFQMALLCAAFTIMMAGYLKGGAVGITLVAALTATTLTGWLLAGGHPVESQFEASSLIGIGAVGLFSLLMIGRFFGELSTGEGLAVLLAPLLCWLTEIGGLQTKNPWLANIVRSMLVGIALLIVLFIAKRNFDREMGPLLVIKQQVESVPSQTEERSRAGSNVLITA